LSHLPTARTRCRRVMKSPRKPSSFARDTDPATPTR
jgi:hypothetical protein